MGRFLERGFMKTKRLTLYSLVTALYVLLSLGFAELSFGPFQFRVAELLNLLAFYHPGFVLPLSLGCAISNLFSPFGMVDVVVGTLHTFISLKAMGYVKKDWVAALFPGLFAFIIGGEITLLSQVKLSFILITGQIMVSEFILGLISVPLYRGMLKNLSLKDYLKEL